MVDITEQSLQANLVDKESIDTHRLVKFNDRTVYNYEMIHENPEMPNSCIISLFEISNSMDKQRSAAARVLIKFLEEPFFNTLRTNE
jgi:secreted Zn-dependent insulinase-like peptidase